MSLRRVLGTPAPPLHVPHQVFLRKAETDQRGRDEGWRGRQLIRKGHQTELRGRDGERQRKPDRSGELRQE